MAGRRSSSRSANHRDVMRLNLSRLHFIDFARTFAVVLALLAHSLNNTKVFDRMGADSLYITRADSSLPRRLSLKQPRDCGLDDFARLVHTVTRAFENIGARIT